MGDWTEKACLWMASIGKSGLGKTPLNQKCGGAFLKKTQSGWMQEFDDAKKEWERAVKNAKEEPKSQDSDLGEQVLSNVPSFS